jgi:hypothetical protein
MIIAINPSYSNLISGQKIGKHTLELVNNPKPIDETDSSSESEYGENSSDETELENSKTSNQASEKESQIISALPATLKRRHRRTPEEWEGRQT